MNHNILASSRKLVSFWDVTEFSMKEIMAWNALQVDLMNLKLRSVQAPGGRISASEKESFLNFHVPSMRQFCNKLELNSSLQQINNFGQNLFFGRVSSDSDVSTLLENFQLTLRDEVYSRKFAFVPQAKVSYFEQEKLFGEDVDIKFPSARSEIKEAGNCLAFNLNTASIFHLMRVVELGLRAIAKKLKVKIKKTPVEYATWETVIHEIEQQIGRLKQLPKGQKKSELLEFYHGLMGEFNGFKDVWRNNTMHTRKSYNEAEALGVYLRVRGFMQRLSTEVSESK